MRRKPYKRAPEYDHITLSIQLKKEEAISKSPDVGQMQIIVIDSRTSIVRPISDDPEKAKAHYLSIYENRKHVINNIV